jgi:hypothetical protein
MGNVARPWRVTPATAWRSCCGAKSRGDTCRARGGPLGERNGNLGTAWCIHTSNKRVSRTGTRWRAMPARRSPLTSNADRSQGLGSIAIPEDRSYFAAAAASQDARDGRIPLRGLCGLRVHRLHPAAAVAPIAALRTIIKLRKQDKIRGARLPQQHAR